MTGMMRVPRSRGALSGVLLVLLGAWGGLVPFVGPHFHYAYTPDSTWAYTSGRLLLEILPGAATALGGLIVLASKFRPAALFGAWLAALSGAWFAVGGILSVLWTKGGVTAAGSPVGGTVARVAEQIGFFAGLGVVIVFLAALALGRFTVIGVRETKIIAREQEVRDQEVRDQEIAAEGTPAPAASPEPGARTSPEPSTVAAASTPAEVSTPAEAEAEHGEAAETEAETPDKVKVTS
jgi:hypothetical protein